VIPLNSIHGSPNKEEGKKDMKEISRRAMKASIAILLISLISVSVYATYHWWNTKPITMNAFISTSLELGVYSDPECLHNLTNVDWGGYGAGYKNMTVYYKNLGNDKGYFSWNLTGTGWTLVSSPYIHYTDGKFNFTLCTGDPYRLNTPIEPNTENLLSSGEIGSLNMVCWTEGYLAVSSAWTVYFNFYDNLS
jgi:hypothetical protein